MKWKDEWKSLIVLVAGFLFFYYLPVGQSRFDTALTEALYLVKWYAREHVILCLIPAFFIAGAIAVFVSQTSVMKYLGAGANKVMAYGVASVSGSVLAVCSCTVLPLFGSIYKMGAGIGPATAFLYSGPAVNVLAIILTARVLGIQIGIARAVGAVIFSVVIGLFMSMIFGNDEDSNAHGQMVMPDDDAKRTLCQNALYFAAMVAVMVFANWGKPDLQSGFFYAVYIAKWYITGISALVLAVVLIVWFGVGWIKILLVALPTIVLAYVFPGEPLAAFGTAVVGLSFIISRDSGECGEWFSSSWGFAKQIAPLLLSGVFIAGMLLGRSGSEGVIPSGWITSLVGGNSLRANFIASIVGAFMYFATLTEVPILQGLVGSGMGKGPALALLLAGPALSLPNMLVLKSIMGLKKTIVFCSLVVIMATVSGIIFGYVVV